MEEWTAVSDPDKFGRYFAHRMSRGVPPAPLKGLYDMWRSAIFASL